MLEINLKPGAARMTARKRTMREKIDRNRKKMGLFVGFWLGLASFVLLLAYFPTQLLYVIGAATAVVTVWISWQIVSGFVDG